MSSNYLIARKWALTSRFAITDEMGTPRFEVQGKSVFSGKLVMFDMMGSEVAVISRRGLGTRYQIETSGPGRGQPSTVRPRGFFGKRFEIESPAGLLEAQGNFSGRQYSITRGGMPVAGVTQLRTFREQFSAEVTDGEDTVFMLAVVLAIEAIRADRRSASAAGT